MSQHDQNPKVIEKTLEIYNTALAMIAHSDIKAYESQKAWEVLKTLQGVKEDLENRLVELKGGKETQKFEKEEAAHV